jgi:hypothetical protein
MRDVGSLCSAIRASAVAIWSLCGCIAIPCGSRLADDGSRVCHRAVVVGFFPAAGAAQFSSGRSLLTFEAPRLRKPEEVASVALLVVLAIPATVISRFAEPLADWEAPDVARDPVRTLNLFGYSKTSRWRLVGAEPSGG